MNVATMTMPKAQAKRMLREYRARLLKKNDDELRAVAEGLKWMARGRAVINVSEAIGAAPLDKLHRPMLAICRADRTQVNFRWGARETVAHFSAERPWGSRGARGDSVTVDMGRPNPHAEIGSDSINRWAPARGSAMVPMVPPDALKQAHTGTTALGRFFILWEVEEWKPTPPRDPFLLQHLGGDLYVVLAEWELTELERAVIAGTRRA